MMKVVLKLDFTDEKTKKKAMKNISGISGVESISMDSKDKKLTVTGDIDPVAMVAKLRKLCHTEIVTVGPAKEPEKKKEEPKKKDGPKEDEAAQMLKAYQSYYQQHPYYHQSQAAPAYYARSPEEDPNGCVIC
ncbi:heavy metal-associated isoprenylated plant protein 12-like [Primulina huaijiensis]|uniref:heavy metal-associated isoprenylated plant protein 12-like n=1 Tax=Primulina huaijiensis TaxID=1492673 RepID=UPI003CC72125